MGARHRFRFFVPHVGAEGGTLHVQPADAHHLDVVRLGPDDRVDLVDADGTVWEARPLGDGLVELLRPQAAAADVEACIELVAGVLTGARFDELVDGAVQAGVARIVPFATTTKDVVRIDERRARLQRIAEAAAKQSKRTIVPSIAAAIDATDLCSGPTGIVLDAAGVLPLDAAVRRVGVDDTVRLLVGPADGLAPELLAALRDAGWTTARMGPTILRAELAAAVAVAIAALHRT